MRNTSPGWILAAYYWSPYLAFAVLEGERIIELDCYRLTGGRAASDTANAHFHKLAQDYAPDLIVVPPVAALLEAGAATNCLIQTISMTTAKETLLGFKHRATHRDLLAELVRRYPELKPYLPNLTGGRSDVAAMRSRSAVQLLPVALGLAAATASPEGHHVFTRP